MDSFQDKKEIGNIETTQDVSINKDFEVLFFSNKDKNLFFIYQKIKKLSAALYLITNFFDESEPLRSSLRTLSVSFLSMSARMHNAPTHRLKEIQTSVESLILEALSLLEVASLNGLISPMNISILKREFYDMVSRYRIAVEDKGKETLTLESHFLMPKEEGHTAQGRHGVQAGDVLKRAESFILPNSGLYSLKQKEKISTVINPDEVYDEEKKEKLKDFGSVAVKKNRRQSLIVGLLKRKKEIMIKDIVGLVTDCSEKTIQRELSLLVDSGLLKKEGQRRWTRYSMA